MLAAPIVPREGPAYVLYTVGTDDAGLLASDERLPGELDRAVLSLVARVVTQYLEGRHAVQLQAQIEAERRQRALAETLRDLANELTSALQLGDVLQRLLDFLHRAVPCERVVGLLRQGEALEVAAARGEVMALGQLTLPAEAPFLSRLAAVGSSVVVDEAVVLGAPRAEAGGEASRPVLCVPVLWSHAESPGGHELRGLLVLGRAQGRGFSAAEADTASLLASQAAIAFRNAALFEEVQRLATTDALTGACNRRHFLQRASRGLHRVLTDKQPVSVLMLDIDHFKSFNDTHGHAVGDQVLRHVAGHCQAVLREVDVFGRLGGEEFAVFLEASAEVAQGVAERIRQAVQTPLVTEGKTLSVTVSVGVAVAARDLLATLPEPDRALAETLRRADEALYAAKQQGRNRVCLAPAG